MFKKLVALALVAILGNLVFIAPAYAASKEEKQVRFAGKVRQSVLKFGTGQSARVKVKLRDKTKLQGFISAADDERFTVTDATGVATTIAYTDVKSVQGNNLSTGAKIAIGVGFAALAVFIILWYTTGPGSD